MNEYVCIYNNEDTLNHCVKLISDTCDNAKVKFIKYLKTKDIHNIDNSKIYLINYSYLKII